MLPSEIEPASTEYDPSLNWLLSLLHTMLLFAPGSPMILHPIAVEPLSGTMTTPSLGFAFPIVYAGKMYCLVNAYLYGKGLGHYKGVGDRHSLADHDPTLILPTVCWGAGVYN